MKCYNCGFKWEEKLIKDKKGYYKTEGIRCPKCKSERTEIKMVNKNDN